MLDTVAFFRLLTSASELRTCRRDVDYGPDVDEAAITSLNALLKQPMPEPFWKVKRNG